MRANWDVLAARGVRLIALNPVERERAADDCKSDLLQPTLEQIILIQSEIVSEFVQVSRVNLVEEDFFVLLREIPKVLQKQNNLWRHWQLTFFDELRSRKQAERIRLDAVGDESGVRCVLEGDR